MRVGEEGQCVGTDGCLREGLRGLEWVDLAEGGVEWVEEGVEEALLLGVTAQGGSLEGTCHQRI